MATKFLKSLSPPGNTIEVFSAGGTGIMSNCNPCHYDIPEATAAIGISIALSDVEPLFDDGDEHDDEYDDDIEMLVFIKR